MGTAISKESDIEDINCGNDNCKECADCVYNPKLYGTIKPYSRAIIICTGNQLWPEKIESLENTFVGILLKFIKQNEENINGKVKVTLCDEQKINSNGYDLYVYPDAIKYIGMTEANIEEFVVQCLVNNGVSQTLQHIRMKDQFLVTVCIHGSRDKRCGRAGPLIINKIKNIIQEKNLINTIKVVGSSHIGGHKYGGIVAVYPSGDHYGLVGERNVEEIINHHLENNHVYRPLWKGKMIKINNY